MSISVFGSINMDLVARTAHLPVPGETLTGRTFHTIPGGKGANQAVACARLGAETYMVGRVGNDVFGTSLKNELGNVDVDHRFVEIDGEASSGIALIAVEDSAENFIIVIPGANGRVDESDLNNVSLALQKGSILLLQLEIPLDMVVLAAKMAHDKGGHVILDPAPAVELPAEIYPCLTFLTPNETEAETLVGFPIRTQEDAAQAARILHARGAQNIIIKMGKRGVFARLNGTEKFHHAFPVNAVDTVAAGDAFNGALAVALSENKTYDDAVRWGLAAGALAVTEEGAQPAMPERQTLQDFLKANQQGSKQRILK
jgi:ribokinase